MLKKTAPFLATALAVTLSCHRPQKTADDECGHVIETLQPMLDTLKLVRSEHVHVWVFDVTDPAEEVAYQRTYKQLPADFRENYQMAIYPSGNWIRIANKKTGDGFQIDYDNPRKEPRKVRNVFTVKNLSSKIRNSL